MIPCCKIKNFQSHKKTILKFSPNVNAIIGSTESGKTAIFRALNWLINNTPKGTSFKSKWGGLTSVSSVFDNTKISRTRGKSKNNYKVANSTLSAFGKSIPEEVSSLIRMDKINYHSQFASPFMLFDSAGEVARTLNKIVCLDVIDSSLSEAKKKLTEYKRRLTSARERKGNILSELSQYDFLSAAEERLTEIESSFSILSNLKRARAELKSLLEEYQEKKNLKILSVDTKNLKEKAQLIKKEETELEHLTEEANDLVGIILSLNQNKEELEQTTRELKSMEETLKRITPDVCPLCGK